MEKKFPTQTQQNDQNPTCLISSGVFCGGTGGAVLLSPFVTTSYSLATLRALT